MKPRSTPRSIPRGAVARPGKGPGAATHYFLRGRLVAGVCWHDNGRPAWVWHYDADGNRHGPERYYFEDGRREWEAHHVHGLQHGPQRQWDRKGRLLCETRFVSGTGRDLWWGDEHRSFPSELRELVAGKRHGVEQWWDSPRTVHRESYYFEDVEHGIRREWDIRGRLRKGFPQFHVRGRKVSRATYERAAISDPTLPPYRPEEDRPARRFPIPPGGLARRRRARSGGGGRGRGRGRGRG